MVPQVRKKLLVPVAIATLFAIAGYAHPEEIAEKNVQNRLKADLAGQVNPDGVVALFELSRRWIGTLNKELNIPASYFQTGLGLGSTPAYGILNAHLEWQPVIFASLRMQYDFYRYYGANAGLLSFPSAGSPFGEKEVEALEGREEAAYGNRFLVRPTLYATAGPILIMNRTDLAYVHYTGQGPFFLDWNYETLLSDDDHVIENRTNVLLELRKGTGKARILAGPYYEIMHASSSRLRRNRAGGMVSWIPADSWGPLKRPRVYAQAGVYLHDRNREGEGYAALGAGFDF